MALAADQPQIGEPLVNALLDWDAGGCRWESAGGSDPGCGATLSAFYKDTMQALRREDLRLG